MRGATDQVSVGGRLCFFQPKVLRGGFLGRLAATHERQQADEQQPSEGSGGRHGGGHGAGGCVEVSAGGRTGSTGGGCVSYTRPEPRPVGRCCTSMPDIWLKVADTDQNIQFKCIHFHSVFAKTQERLSRGHFRHI